MAGETAAGREALCQGCNEPIGVKRKVSRLIIAQVSWRRRWGELSVESVAVCAICSGELRAGRVVFVGAVVVVVGEIRAKLGARWSERGAKCVQTALRAHANRNGGHDLSMKADKNSSP